MNLLDLISTNLGPRAWERWRDRWRGVETAALDIERYAPGCRGYAPSPGRIEASLIDRIAEQARGYTFIDIGCGKGRVLMTAAERPFARVIGIEHNPELAEVARANLRHHFRQRDPAHRPTVICAGALTWPLPPTPLVLYLFAPFDPNVMDEFLARVTASHRERPRPMILVFYNTRAYEGVFRMHLSGWHRTSIPAGELPRAFDDRSPGHPSAIFENGMAI